MTEQIILASASPRRGELLRQIGVSYRSVPVDIDESVHDGESVDELTRRLALQKAQTARQQVLEQGCELPVLGSDTLVEIDGSILGKPADGQQAAAMLAKLSGRQHNVLTAVALVCAQGEFTAISRSRVYFTDITAQGITAYVDSGEPLDKAGAYAVQGLAAQFIERIDGSYSGIMGLPLYETAQLLNQASVATL